MIYLNSWILSRHSKFPNSLVRNFSWWLKFWFMSCYIWDCFNHDFFSARINLLCLGVPSSRTKKIQLILFSVSNQNLVQGILISFKFDQQNLNQLTLSKSWLWNFIIILNWILPSIQIILFSVSNNNLVQGILISFKFYQQELNQLTLSKSWLWNFIIILSHWNSFDS